MPAAPLPVARPLPPFSGEGKEEGGGVCALKRCRRCVGNISISVSSPSTNKQGARTAICEGKANGRNMELHAGAKWSPAVAVCRAPVAWTSHYLDFAYARILYLHIHRHSLARTVSASMRKVVSIFEKPSGSSFRAQAQARRDLIMLCLVRPAYYNITLQIYGIT